MFPIYVPSCNLCVMHVCIKLYSALDLLTRKIYFASYKSKSKIMKMLLKNLTETKKYDMCAVGMHGTWLLK